MTTLATHVILACAVYPFLEEVVFRAGLLRLLDENYARARLRNNMLTALVFGLCHVPAWGVEHAALVMLPSLLLGYLYQATGKLSLPVVAHGVLNFAGLWVPRW